MKTREKVKEFIMSTLETTRDRIGFECRVEIVTDALIQEGFIQVEEHDYKQWVPEEEGMYYTMNGIHEPLCTYWYNKNFDFDRAKDQNVFRTESEAQRIADIQRIQRKMIDIIKFVRGDWRPDWMDLNQYKYHLYYDGNGIDFDWVTSSSFLPNEIYFSLHHKEEVLRLVNKELTKEEIQTYWGGEEYV